MAEGFGEVSFQDREHRHGEDRGKQHAGRPAARHFGSSLAIVPERPLKEVINIRDSRRTRKAAQYCGAHPYIEGGIDPSMEPPQPDEIEPEPEHLDHELVEPPPPLPPATELPDGP
jgi:hypothetical protein